MVSTNASKSFTNNGKSVSLLKGTYFEGNIVQIVVRFFLFLCNKPIPETFWSYCISIYIWILVSLFPSTCSSGWFSLSFSSVQIYTKYFSLIGHHYVRKLVLKGKCLVV
jgi:hypothetical protein